MREAEGERESEGEREVVEVKNKTAEVEKENPARKEEIRAERCGEDSKKREREREEPTAPEVRETPGRGD